MMAFCGTLARYIVYTFPISGRLLAVAINFCDCWARYCGELPPRSCRYMENPAPLPSPMIGGGPTAMTVASVMVFIQAALTSFVSWMAVLVRFFHSFNVTKKVAEFGDTVLVRRLFPLMVVYSSTSGIFFRMASTLLVTASVRCKYAASGS